MTTFCFDQVDVFTDRPLLGNPLAVVHGADALDDAAMQAVARWTNLSETAFLLTPTEPGADYRVRIWTPTRELPFAGHPTLGSCHAWLGRGGVPRRAGEVFQECSIGVVRLRVDSGRTAFAAPPLTRADVDEPTVVAATVAVGVDRSRVVAAQWLRNGPNWLTLLLDSAAAVLEARMAAAHIRHFDEIGLVGAHAGGHDTAFEVRGFVGGEAPYEDPVTGSLNAGIAEWLMAIGRAPDRYVAAQGTRMQRAGRVHVVRDGGTLWIGGDAVTCVSGELVL